MIAHMFLGQFLEPYQLMPSVQIGSQQVNLTLGFYIMGKTHIGRFLRINYLMIIIITVRY